MSLSLGKIIGRPVRVTLFCKNAPTIWDQHRLKGALKPGVFTPKAYTPKTRQGLSLLIQVQPRKTFLHIDFIYELYKTHDSTIILKIVLTRRPLRVLALTRRP
ncbi:hypothetical protein HKD37_09G025310 [Glycine soja]